MSAGQAGLDGVLAAQQPVHRGVDLVAARADYPEVRAQGGVIPPTQRRQLRLRVDHPRQDQGISQVPFPARRPQQCGQPQPGGHGMDQGDVPVRQRAAHLQRRVGLHQRLALEHRIDRVHRGGRQHRQVRQRLLANLAVGFAVRAAQQRRLVVAGLPRRNRVPTPHPVYVHPTRRSPTHAKILAQTPQTTELTRRVFWLQLCPLNPHRRRPLARCARQDRESWD